MQGQGGGTLDKERKIGAAESIGMTIANGLAKRHTWRQTRPYFHLDLNAGSGWNDIAGCPGSPLVFCEVAQRKITAMPLYAWFCDRDAGYIERLERWLVQYGHLPQPGISLLCEDNQSVIRRFAEQIARRDDPQYALGSLLCDPNIWFYRGRDGGGVPVDDVLWFAETFPRIDIIMNLNYRFYAQARNSRFFAGHPLLSPDEMRVLFNRNYWLVSRQHLGGQNRFWLAIARNIPTGDYKRLGLHHWDSPEGSYIMNIVSGARQGNFEDALEETATLRKPVTEPELRLILDKRKQKL